MVDGAMPSYLWFLEGVIAGIGGCLIANGLRIGFIKRSVNFSRALDYSDAMKLLGLSQIAVGFMLLAGVATAVLLSAAAGALTMAFALTGAVLRSRAKKLDSNIVQ